MTEPSEENDFEAFLKTRSMLRSPAAGTERLEPSAEVDQQILARASRAIRARAPVQPYRAPRWALPAGLAATILLAIAIVVNVDFRGLRPARSVAQAPATAAPAAQPREPEAKEAAPGDAKPAAAPAARAALPAPREWLERIEKLRQDGHGSEADAELERFRRAYPHDPIPPEAARSPRAPSSP